MELGRQKEADANENERRSGQPQHDANEPFHLLRPPL
jgi:hypothetical protein